MALSGEERIVLVELSLVVPLISGALWMLGTSRTYRLLRRWSGIARAPGVHVEASTALAHRLGQLVKVAARHGAYGATCLQQSLALWWILRRHGLPAELRIGVGKTNPKLTAHAWVEIAGEVINDDPAVAKTYSAYSGVERRLPRSS